MPAPNRIERARDPGDEDPFHDSGTQTGMADSRARPGAQDVESPDVQRIVISDVAGEFEITTRAGSPAYPPQAEVAQALSVRSEAVLHGEFHSGYDCSEHAEELMAVAPGRMHLLRVDSGTRFEEFRVPELNPDSGSIELSQYVNHYVATDGRYAYDPQISGTPIPLGDYRKLLRLVNEGENLSFYEGKPGEGSDALEHRLGRVGEGW